MGIITEEKAEELFFKYKDLLKSPEEISGDNIDDILGTIDKKERGAVIESNILLMANQSVVQEKECALLDKTKNLEEIKNAADNSHPQNNTAKMKTKN